MNIHEELNEHYREEGHFLGGVLSADEEATTNGRSFPRVGISVHESTGNFIGTDNLFLSSSAYDLPASAGTRTWAV